MRSKIGLALLILPKVFCAQTDSVRYKVLHHEISFIALSYFVTPSYSYEISSYVGNPATGLSYKYFITQKHAIRIAAEYLKNEIKYPIYYTPMSVSGAEFTKQGSLGYERVFRINKRTRPYAFTDMSYGQTKGIATTEENVIRPGQAANVYTYYDSTIIDSQKLTSLQCRFGGGVKFFADDHFFLSAEGSFGIGYYYGSRQSETRAFYSNGVNGYGSYFYHSLYPIIKEKCGGLWFSGNLLRISFAALF